MTLVRQVLDITDDFDAVEPEVILDTLEQVCASMSSPLTREYLTGKISKARQMHGEEKRSLCKSLRPYLDWYIQGSAT